MRLAIVAGTVVLAIVAGALEGALAQVPDVVSTVPGGNQLGVSASTNISVTFDTDMNAATIDSSSFVVNSMTTGLHGGTINYDSPSRTATLDPYEDFDDGEVVTVVLTTAIQSSGGTPLEASYAWSFTVDVGFGTGFFDPPVDYLAGNSPYSIFAADLDGDGDQDLATVIYSLDQIAVFKNDGGGAYSLDSTYDVGSAPRAVFAADLNKDGSVDLVTANEHHDNVSVLLNNGDGDFGPASPYAVGARPYSVLAADLNGDGALDLATADWDANTVSVLVNTGSGTFGTATGYGVGNSPAWVHAADLDGDQDLDIAVACCLSDKVYVLWNSGDGDFPTQSNFDVDAWPYSVYAADLNGDGNLDLVTADYSPDNVSVLISEGGGSFEEYFFRSVGATPMSVYAADLDGDGDLDIATANDGSGDVSVLLNDGGGTFATHVDYNAGSGPMCVFAADLDGDGDLDLATANRSSNNISVIFNSPPQIVAMSPVPNALTADVSEDVSVSFNVEMDAATFNDSTILVSGMSSGLHGGAYTYHSQTRTGYLNPDVDFIEGEIVTVVLTPGVQAANGTPAASYTWSFTVDVADGAGAYGDEVRFASGGYTSYSVFAADLDGDAYIDLAVANATSDNVSVLINNRDSTFTLDSLYAVGTYPRSVFASDVNTDGMTDLVTADQNSHSLSILLNQGSGDFVLDSTCLLGSSPRTVVAADLNGDGAPDLATAEYSWPHGFSVLMNNGDGTFSADSTYQTTPSPEDIIAADLNGDGAQDLAVTHSTANDVWIMFNNGEGRFTLDSVYVVGANPRAIFAADFDGEGTLDLVTANYDSDNLSVLMNDGSGGFAVDSVYAVEDRPASVFAAHLNGDGHIDLAAANSGGSTISVLLNAGDGTFECQPSIDIGGGGPREIFCPDLDRDGDCDLVTANSNSDDVSILLNPDLPRPHVDSTLPAANEGQVPGSSDIQVVFDMDMDDASIDNSSFVVHARSTGFHPGSFNYEAGTYTATLDPTDDFCAGEVVTVVLTTDIESAESAPLDSSRTWSFTVGTTDGSGTFESFGECQLSGSSQSVFAADLDGDGDLDLATADYAGEDVDSVSVLLNNGDGTFGLRSSYPVPMLPQSVLAADLDGDGDMDLAAISDTEEGLSILLNSGSGDFEPAVSYEVVLGPVSHVAADLDGDGDLDLATANSASDDVSVFLNDGHAAFFIDSTYGVALGPECIVSGDFDEDGSLDLATVSTGLDSVSVLLNNRDGTFGPFLAYAAGGADPRSVVAADFDGDGHLDLATANESSEDFSVLVGAGDGSFSIGSVYPTYLWPVWITAGDLDGDGDPDLVTAHQFSSRVIVHTNVSGAFAPTCSVSVGNDPCCIVAAPLDDHWDLDLAVSNYGDATVSIHLNEGTSGVDGEGPILPRRFALLQNRPNPFSTATQIRYHLVFDCHVKLEIYNVMGQKVATLVDGFHEAGRRTVRWDTGSVDSRQVSSGIYFYRLEAGDFTATRKMVLLK